MTRSTTYAAFLKQKQELAEKFEAAARKALTDMGDDVRKISWFSSYANEALQTHEKLAA